MSETLLSDFLRTELSALSEKNLLRRPPQSAGPNGASPSQTRIILCSNDYLGYAAEPWPSAPGTPLQPDSYPSGAGASRLISGHHPAHQQAERHIAQWVGTESSLLFSSGYAANLGTIAALIRPGDLILSDAFNHASIIDGCRLSGAQIEIIPHRNTEAYERALQMGSSYRRRWVITESYFSMDGDIPDLQRLRSLCDRYQAIFMVDEAHALGVFGPKGAGLCAEAGIRPDILVGTLGKAIGLQGAFVAGSTLLYTYLWNRARSFVFSTGISPYLAKAIDLRIQRVADDDAGREKLLHLSHLLRTRLLELGAQATLKTQRGPILPWIVGDARRAVELSERLLEAGIFVQAIRPPTVPPNTARLRFSVSASLSERDIQMACEHLRNCFT